MKKGYFPKSSITSVITASSVGTLIEWYDFFIFGSLATIISTNFFPRENPAASFLATLATFSAGLIVRPVGAIVFGRLGDIIGRKHTFMVTLSVMGVSTVGMGLVPGYETIGFMAPVIVLILRLVQGLALGGEYGGAAVYIAEHSPPGKRGLLTSWIQTTSGLAFILSVTVILLIKSLMAEEAWLLWGWRIPFLASVFLVGVSIYVRRKMSESPLFAEAVKHGGTSKNPLRESFGNKENLKTVLLAFFGLLIGIGTIGWITFYAQSFFLKTLNLDYNQANRIIIIGILAGVPFFLFFGWLSDKIGRKYLMLTGMLLGIFLFRPVFQKMFRVAHPAAESRSIVSVTNNQSVKTVGEADTLTTLTTEYFYSDGSKEIIVEQPAYSGASDINGSVKTILVSKQGEWELIFWIFVLQLLFTVTYGPLAAYMVELFPLKIRYTSISLPYHFGVGIFGGLAPYVASYLVNKAAGKGSVDYYLAGLNYPIFLSSVSLVTGLIYLRETRGRAKVHILPVRYLNPVRKWMGVLWILLAGMTIWFGIIETGIPKILSGNQEDIVFGIIISLIITPALALGLFIFGRYALGGEYDS